MRLLLVAMYWPPAGGAGVQRPLKLARHLAELGVEVHVLAPADPKWVHRDASLVSPPTVTVHRARNLGPRSRVPAEELRAAGGPLGRLALHGRLAFRRLLVPDASVLFDLTAIPAAISLVRRLGIDAVLTTSPPGSLHLAGAAAKRATGVRWVADLRDSVGSHPHRRREVRGEGRLARLVARRADAVVCASRAIAVEMEALGVEGRLAVIGNGCDFEDFEGLEYRRGDRFRITHAGSFFGRRDPRPFLQALTRCDGVVARFVGDFRSTDREYAEGLGLGDRLDLIPYSPRAETLRLQRDSDALLLVIPEAEGRGKGVLSGKVFEYLAAERPILAAVPPDGEAAALVRGLGAGVVVPPDDVDALTEALAALERRWREGTLGGLPLSPEARGRLSRRARAEELLALLESLEGTGGGLK